MSPRGELRMVPDAEPRTYYDRAVLKEPVWKARYIPTYLFTGGLSAGCSLLGLGASLTGRHGLARRMRLGSLGAIAASTGVLVADLGRPERFHHMLRVLKPSSPMNVGSWLLAAYGPATGAAVVPDVLGRYPRLGRVAEAAAAALAPAVATYTAVLVADTAVPAWHEARGDLPWVFAAGAAASAGGLGLLTAPTGEDGPARRMALAGAAAELASTQLMEHRLGELGEPYHSGPAGLLSRIATVSTAAGGGLVALAAFASTPNRRLLDRVGGAVLLVGAAVERFAVYEAGRSSARDPRYTVGPQRRRLDERADRPARVRSPDEGRADGPD